LPGLSNRHGTRTNCRRLEPNAMCYMMSKDQYLQDDGGHWHPHMMWYVSGDAKKSWGANLAGVPAMSGYVPQDRMTVFLVLVNHWSTARRPLTDGRVHAQTIPRPTMRGPASRSPGSPPRLQTGT